MFIIQDSSFHYLSKFMFDVLFQNTISPSRNFDFGSQMIGAMMGATLLTTGFFFLVLAT